VSDATSQDPGSLTYEPYFGLREKPFSLSPDPRFFFSNASHGATFDALVAGIRRREGILALTGEVGTGKTTVCRAVLQSLDRKTFAAFVPDPFLSREDLLKTLLVDFGVVSVDDIRNGRLRGASRTDLSYTLYEFLTSLQPLQAFAVVMIDEAQNLPATLLEEIRILSDLENRQKLLQLLLVGQPELESRLGTPEMRQLTQRLSVRCELPPLARQDVRPYVSYRLTIAGNNGTLRFTDAAIDLVCDASSGIPRVINLICDRALLRAARAGTMTVDAEHILGAVDDLKLPVHVIGRLAHVVDGADIEMVERRDSAPLALEALERPAVSSESLRKGFQSDEAIEPRVAGAIDLVARSLSALDSERPGPNLESLDREWREAPAERGQRRPQPQLRGEGSLPAADPIANRLDGLVRAATERSSFSTPRTLLDSQLGDTRVRSVPEAPASNVAFEDETLPAELAVPGPGPQLMAVARDGSFEDLAKWLRRKDLVAATPQRRTRLLALVITLLAVTTAGVGYWYWMPAASPQGPDVLTRPTLPLVPPEPQALPAAPADAVSPARESEPARSQSPAAGQARAPRFVLQMATFLSAARAEQSLQEFRDAGYRAYSIEVSLRDGARAIAVLLGPYAERAPAERDLERARQIPGHDSGRIVQIGPSALPTASQP